MLKEAYCVKYNITNLDLIHQIVRMEIILDGLTLDQLHEFFECPLIYIKKSETDNDFVCPMCGASLS